MSLRYHPRYSRVDPDDPRAWGTCDRCGFIWNLYQLAWQNDFRGAPMLQNIRVLVCPKCLDAIQPQLQPYILPPDPAPIFNARPENYVVDETSWLVTMDDSILATETDVDFVTSLPNPDSTESLVEQGEAFLTTFDGDPIVTEAGEGNDLNLNPNLPSNGSGSGGNGNGG